MVAGFLLIALLLGWATVRSWLLVEDFVDKSQQATRSALQVNQAVQDLAERSVSLERNSRQFIVLKDPAILVRVDREIAASLVSLDRLEAVIGDNYDALGALAADWRQSATALATELRNSPGVSHTTPATLAQLADISRDLDRLGRRWINEQPGIIETQLVEKRQQLGAFVAAAVGGALFVALAMSWWLSRPLRAIERTIERLGQSRFDEPVPVRGPADLREVGRRLDWLRTRLGALESERERSLRHVSHELKTPLTALREGIALLQEEVVGALDSAQAEVVDILQHNVMTLQRHIESLLRLNAISFEARRLNHRPLAIDKLLADVVRGRELQIQARKLSVECAAPATTCLLDGEKLHVALDNLLSNAIDFSPEGALIRFEAKLSGKRLQVACIDQGNGVAAEDAERIFEPFVQGKRAPPTPRQGSGVGLSIVRELTSAMGGTVRVVKNDLGSARGATFEIELPYER
jgi:two-component system sensor histidine kinase GlrK